jgi:hypothetical protein
MSAVARAIRERQLRALGVEPLRLHARGTVTTRAAPSAQAVAPQATAIRRLALQPDPAELDDPVIRNMYAALTEAVGKAGLQRVRVCDVAGDPSAAVMVFGAAPLPEGVPAVRVLRADPLGVLHTDRERKRELWERMQALGRGGSS